MLKARGSKQKKEHGVRLKLRQLHYGHLSGWFFFSFVKVDREYLWESLEALQVFTLKEWYEKAPLRKLWWFYKCKRHLWESYISFTSAYQVVVARHTSERVHKLYKYRPTCPALFYLQSTCPRLCCTHCQPVFYKYVPSYDLAVAKWSVCALKLSRFVFTRC